MLGGTEGNYEKYVWIDDIPFKRNLDVDGKAGLRWIHLIQGRNRNVSSSTC
jgi:hypothetical protein